MTEFVKNRNGGHWCQLSPKFYFGRNSEISELPACHNEYRIDTKGSCYRLETCFKRFVVLLNLYNGHYGNLEDSFIPNFMFGAECGILQVPGYLREPKIRLHCTFYMCFKLFLIFVNLYNRNCGILEDSVPRNSMSGAKSAIPEVLGYPSAATTELYRTL